MTQPTTSRTCDHCGKPITGPVAKRFCSDHCRQSWHLAKRKRALAELQQREQLQQPKTGGLP